MSRLTMAMMRHDAATMSAKIATDKLQQSVDTLELRLARANVELSKAYHAAYYTAFDALGAKAFNAAYGKQVANAKEDFDKAADALEKNDATR